VFVFNPGVKQVTQGSTLPGSGEEYQSIVPADLDSHAGYSELARVNGGVFAYVDLCRQSIIQEILMLEHDSAIAEMGVADRISSQGSRI